MQKPNLPRIQTRSDVIAGLYLREEVLEEGPLFEPPLLLLHGRCHGAWVYERWSCYFALAGWRCVSMSLRNHPGSRSMDKASFLNTGIDDYVEDLCSALDWIGDLSVVVGHSLGGIIAQKTAQFRPLAGLVLVASVGPSQLGQYSDDFPLDKLVDDAPEYRRRGQFDMARRVVPESPKALNDVRGRTPIDRSTIACPILVVGGDKDDSGVHDPEAIARFYRAPFVIIPNAPHDLMLGDTALVGAACINAWALSHYDQSNLADWHS